MFELKLGAVELALGEPSTVGVARPSLLDTSDTLSASMSVSLAPGRSEKMDVRAGATAGICCRAMKRVCCEEGIFRAVKRVCCKEGVGCRAVPPGE
jgi:hypothetical protein